MELLRNSFLCIALLIGLSESVDPEYSIDFDYLIKNIDITTALWENYGAARTQSQADKSIYFTSVAGAVANYTDTDGNTYGAFSCIGSDGSRATEAIDANYAINIGANTLELVVSPQTRDAAVNGYLYGLTDDGVTTRSDNAIMFGASSHRTANLSNVFWPINPSQDGWDASVVANNPYWDSVGTLMNINAGQTYHIMVSLDASGNVRTYVNGKNYGVTYAATSGAPASVSQEWRLKLCGNAANVGIDAKIRVAALYSSAITTEADAGVSCAFYADQIGGGCNGIPVTTMSPTNMPTTDMPTMTPTLCSGNCFNITTTDGASTTVAGNGTTTTSDAVANQYQIAIVLSVVSVLLGLFGN